MLECRNLEELLGPLRCGPKGSYPLNIDEVSKRLKFTDTFEAPVFSKLGDPEVQDTHEQSLACMDIVAMVGFGHYVPRLADGVPWNLIDHQTAGIACRHPKLVGVLIDLVDEIHQACLAIAQHWYGSSLGGYAEPSLDELMVYRGQLQKIGLDCNAHTTFRHLSEGIYPIDLEQGIAERVLKLAFPLSSLLHESHRTAGLQGMKLFFIASNSD